MNTATNKIRVMLVDDHNIVRQGITLLLNLESDIQVVGEADSGPDSLIQVNLCQPHVIVMDLTMPKGGGLPAIKQLKIENPEIKIVVLTSFSSVESLELVNEAGADAFLIKESGAQHLAAAIRDVFAGKIYIDSSLHIHIKKMFANPLDQQFQRSINLTPRELQIICLIAQGYSNQGITDKLFISLKTVKTHVTNILAKLQLEDRTQVAIHAIRQGWV